MVRVGADLEPLTYNCMLPGTSPEPKDTILSGIKYC